MDKNAKLRVIEINKTCSLKLKFNQKILLKFNEFFKKTNFNKSKSKIPKFRALNKNNFSNFKELFQNISNKLSQRACKLNKTGFYFFDKTILFKLFLKFKKSNLSQALKLNSPLITKKYYQKLTFLIIFFAFLSPNLAKAAPSFEYTYDFKLKKDERASVEIKELGYEGVQNFDFYWTLFDNTNLVVHTKFRKYPRQFVMSLRRNLNWHTQTLIPDYKNPHIDRARLIFEFRNYERGEVDFRVYIEDKDGRLEVKFLDPRKMRLN